MPTEEIPRSDWRTFFDRFSRQHEGWVASLEVMGPDIGVQEQASELVFEGISLSSQDAGPETIAINLGREPEDHVTHTIAEPKRVWLQRTPDGANAALEIESADEIKTLLRFRSALLPEMVDGLVPDR